MNRKCLGFCGETVVNSPRRSFLLLAGSRWSFISVANNTYGDTVRSGPQWIPIYFYLGFAKVSTSRIAEKDPFTLRAFPKGLQYPLGAAQKVSTTCRRIFPAWLHIHEHFLFILLEVLFSHLCLLKKRRYNRKTLKPSAVLLPFLLLQPHHV
jgi:hypothetical protein